MNNNSAIGIPVLKVGNLTKIFTSGFWPFQKQQKYTAVNGVALQDAGIKTSCFGWPYGTCAIDKPLQIPLDHVFVLSDNLFAQHDDSRVFGPISKASILGLAW
jgi:type IV secretory pathway protease TraF